MSRRPAERPEAGRPTPRPPPDEPRPRDRWHRLLGLLLLALSLATGYLGFSVHGFLEAPLPLPAQGQVIEVAPGTSLAVLARRLGAQGLLSQPRWWQWYARYRGLAGQIKAGEFAVPAGTSARGLLELLVRGEAVQYGYTIIEGHTAGALFAALRGHPQLGRGLPADAAGIMAALGRPDLHPEGRFLPDTYYFTATDTGLDLLRRALLALEATLEEIWAGRAPDLPLADPQQALILASIIEKETGLATERRRIAGVFIRRLRLGMLLQTDPTVIYGLGEDFDGNLRRIHLRSDGPYNTYTRKGLPPTPIALAGRAALEAAVHPEETEALYFVGKGDGSHAFSATLAEHNAMVRRYQLKGR